MNGVSTRREIKKNSKYLYDYETEEINTTRRKTRNEEEDRSEKSDKLNTTRRDDKENKEKENISNNRSNGRMKKERESKAENADEENISSENKDTTEKTVEDQTKEGIYLTLRQLNFELIHICSDKKEETRQDSESEEARPISTRRQNNRIENKYPLRRTRNRKMSGACSKNCIHNKHLLIMLLLQILLVRPKSVKSILYGKGRQKYRNQVSSSNLF